MSRQGVTNDPLVWIDCEVNSPLVFIPVDFVIVFHDVYVHLN